MPNPAPRDDPLLASEEVRKPPKNVSLTDPAMQWTAAPGGPAFYSYSTNYLIDVKAGVIVDVEATPAHRTEAVNATKTIVDRVQERFAIAPTHLIGDNGIPDDAPESAMKISQTPGS